MHVSAPAPGRRVALGDVELRVLDEGDGPPVLLLHGFPDRAELWSAVAARLRATGRRTIVPDLRGFGESTAPAGRRAYRLDRTVADVAGLLDALGVREPVELVGHDWGAISSWAFCLAHPGRVSRHVALSVGHPGAYRAAGIEQKVKGLYTLAWQVPVLPERLMAARDFRRVRASLAGRHPGVDQVVADLARPGRLTAGLRWYRANLVPLMVRRWPRCTVPTVGAWGTEDPYLSEDQLRHSARWTAAPFRFVRLDGAGHWLPLERPAEVAALVLDGAPAGA